MRYDALLVDGRNLLYRATQIEKLTTQVPGFGVIPIGGVYGFLRSVVTLVEEYAAERTILIVCWEGDESQCARRARWSEYKAHRIALREERTRSSDPDPVQIRTQEQVLRDLLSRIGVCQAWSEPWEADDTVATLATALESKGRRVGIISSDHDLHQCVTERVHVIDPSRRSVGMDASVWRARDVTKKWGFTPDRIPEVKALQGDKSDGIPGAPGIGETTARNLLGAVSFEDLLKLVEAHDPTQRLTILRLDGSEVVSFTPNKVSTLKRDLDKVRLFRDLCTVTRDAPLQFAPRRREDPLPALRSLRMVSLLSPSKLNALRRLAG